MGSGGKKLTEAARYWARGGRGEDGRLADLKAMGVDEAAAKAWIEQNEPPAPEAFVVWECNWPAVKLFLGLKSQWRRGPFGGVTGLDYGAIPAFMQLRGIPRREWPALFEKLQAMEVEALPVLNQS